MHTTHKPTSTPTCSHVRILTWSCVPIFTCLHTTHEPTRMCTLMVVPARCVLAHNTHAYQCSHAHTIDCMCHTRMAEHVCAHTCACTCHTPTCSHTSTLSLVHAHTQAHMLVDTPVRTHTQAHMLTHVHTQPFPSSLQSSQTLRLSTKRRCLEGLLWKDCPLGWLRGPGPQDFLGTVLAVPGP